MTELKFRNIPQGNLVGSDKPACCSNPSAPEPASPEECPDWITGKIKSSAGEIRQVSTTLTSKDRWEHIKCRTSAFRNSYALQPGLYATGNPDNSSDVFVTANYKMSFDMLRSAIHGMDAWILVLDTKGINVWCAAGKGTFGTEELINRIRKTKLSEVVSHRKIIVPQLGAPGISAYMVKRASGFSVMYGPVRAADLPAYVTAGCKATKQMRTVNFALKDRLVLTPMEINPAMKKYYPWFVIVLLLAFGLQPSGIIFKDAFYGALPFLLMGLTAVFAGAFLTPLLLPFIPFRSFAIKGWLTGLAVLYFSSSLISDQSALLKTASWIFFPLAGSYIALQFTGSTTFTGMTGVKKELRTGIPVYITGSVISMLLLVYYKLQIWGVL